MKLITNEIKNVCSKLLTALDSDTTSTLSETIELTAEDKVFILAVTNMEYVVKTKLPISSDESFVATVNADTFLRLINQITTPEVDFTINDTILTIEGNGKYKLPMVYEGDSLIELPDLSIKNKTIEFETDTSVLTSVLNYNSKELAKTLVGSPVQKMYYFDDKGCITFTSGACVNEFTLPDGVRLLMNAKMVKLFKLFTQGKVNIVLGTDTVNNIVQNKITISDTVVELTSILTSDETMINSVPKDVIRNMTKDSYPYTVSINKKALLDTISRLMLFMPTGTNFQPYGYFEFDNSAVSIYDKSKHNTEKLFYKDSIAVTDPPEELILDLNDLKLSIENIKDECVSLSFGTHRAVVVHHANIYNIIPECVL